MHLKILVFYSLAIVIDSSVTFNISSWFSMPSLPSLPSISLPSFLWRPSVASIPEVPSMPPLSSVIPAELPNFDVIERKAEAFYQTLTLSILEDARLRTPQLIQKYGYPCEVYQMVSPDGYILTVHRIPYGRSGPSGKRPVVFIQHGILASSADWLITGPEKSLGYLLADAGYDVWLGNNRGNTYSRKHVNLDPNTAEFWNFSWHEIGVFDVPTMIDFALNQTKQEKLFYIGHSQGTTVFYIMCSELPAYNKKIIAQFSLSPVAYTGNVRSPLLRLVSPGKRLGSLMNAIGIHEFLPHTDLMTDVASILCSDGSITQVLCTNSLFVLAGFSQKQMNATLIPVIMGHTPAGSSTKQLLHFGQTVNSGEFCQWDYGTAGNMVHYGSVYPPSYQLRKISAPIYLFYSRNDWLSSERDVAKLYIQLTNVKGTFLISDHSFNHIDYLYAIEAPKIVYKDILALMSQY